jgi:hypothetical protein
MELELRSLGELDYDLRPYVISPRPGPSVEDPALPKSDGGSYIHAMGQTHAHTNLSVCIREGDRDAHLSYRWMQDVQHSDFGATTDHAYNMWHTEMLLTRKFAEYYYFPGTFVAIPAYEWTGSIAAVCGHEGGPWGHVNPLYLEEEGDLAFYTPCDPACAGGSLKRLWETYAGRRIVTPPHHVVDALHPYNWDVFDADFEPVIEIFQDQRGSGEQPWAPGVTNNLHQETGHWALPQLLESKRFGFIAGSDHNGIARAGLLVTELTRAALYEAFVARRTFGTTATAMRVTFSCNGSMMGSEIEAEEGDFRVAVTAPEPLHELQILRDGDLIETIPVQGCEAEYAWTTTRERDGEFWYCRVILENGEMAWVSPIWLVNQ